jgi:hypothetical protein
MRLFESGSDIIMSGSGFLNLGDLSSPISYPINGSIKPNSANFLCGGDSYTQLPSSAFTGPSLTIPNNFGLGNTAGVGSGNGVVVGIQTLGLTNYLIVPIGYISNTFLLTMSTIPSDDFSTLGITNGTYNYTWGSGSNAGTLILQVGP